MKPVVLLDWLREQLSRYTFDVVALYRERDDPSLWPFQTMGPEELRRRLGESANYGKPKICAGAGRERRSAATGRADRSMCHSWTRTTIVGGAGSGRSLLNPGPDRQPGE
jgi:hypothetical protein